MGKDRGNLISESQLRFFGKITASVSHEINNVFSVINENSGLLSDWVMRGSRGKPLDPEKLRRVSETIQKSIGRGQKIIKRLNHFSHSVDQPRKEFDVGEVLENIIALSRRLAYQKRVDLVVKLPDNPVTIESNPFALQQAVFNCIAWFLQESQTEDRISIELEKDGSGGVIIITGPRAVEMEPADDEFLFLSLLMEEVKGKINFSSANGTIKLAYPRSASEEQH